MDNPNTTSNPEMWGLGGAVLGALGGWGIAAHVRDHVPLKSLVQAALGLHPLAFGPIPAAAGVVGAAALGGFLYYAFHQEAERHVRGARLHRLDHRPVARALKPKKKARGISIHPKISISEQQECKHLLLLGGSGSGKTSILWPVINQAVERGDRCLIFSFKGDFQQKAQFPFSLLAPWDSRSSRWLLGRDIRTRLDSEALAQTLIPSQEKDPIWSQGAQGLLTAIISQVQTKYGERWGYMHLAQECSMALSDYDFLVETVMRESPLAKSFLMGKDSKTTASFLAQLASNLTNIINIGIADFSAGKVPFWSVNDWLAGRSPATTILGYLPGAEGLSQAFAASVIEQVVKKLLALPDCSPDTRRVWLFLDEVPQAGKIPSITQGLETLRSKGVRVVLGMQSISQLEEHGYSKNTATIWTGQAGTKIIASLVAPDDQKWASNLLGDREVERYQRTVSASFNGQGGSQSGVYQRVSEHVLMPAQFGQELYSDYPLSVRAMVLLTPGAAAILDWPFPPIQHQRAARIDAAWTLPGFQRPIWGAVPPKVGEPGDQQGGRDGVMAQAGGQAQTVIIDDHQQQPRQETQQPAPAAADGLADVMADHLASNAVDAIIPGAGSLLDLMLSAPAGQGQQQEEAPARTGQVRQQVQGPEEDDREAE